MEYGALRRVWTHWMMGHQRRAYSSGLLTVARPATVHVWIRAVSDDGQSLCWPGFQGNGPAGTSRHRVPHDRRTVIRMDWRIGPSPPVFTDVGFLLLCNVIFRPLLFAAAFFMWVDFLRETSRFLQHGRNLSPAQPMQSNL